MITTAAIIGFIYCFYKLNTTKGTYSKKVHLAPLGYVLCLLLTGMFVLNKLFSVL